MKHSKDYLGFGILAPGWHDNVYGSWIWMSNPHSAAELGDVYVKCDEGYSFAPVKVPSV